VPRLLFYTTAGCHLCEQAAEMLNELRATRALEIEAIDIADDSFLFELYGVRIPVVKSEESGDELGWPFDREQLASLF
jgi:hypothetical protein